MCRFSEDFCVTKTLSLKFCMIFLKHNKYENSNSYWNIRLDLTIFFQMIWKKNGNQKSYKFEHIWNMQSSSNVCGGSLKNASKSIV